MSRMRRLTVNKKEEGVPNFKRLCSRNPICCHTVKTDVTIIIVISIFIPCCLQGYDHPHHQPHLCHHHLPASAAVRLLIVRTEPLLFESTRARESATESVFTTTMLTMTVKRRRLCETQYLQALNWRATVQYAKYVSTIPDWWPIQSLFLGGCTRELAGRWEGANQGWEVKKLIAISQIFVLKRQ